MDHLSPPPTYKHARELSKSENKFLPSCSSGLEYLELDGSLEKADLRMSRVRGESLSISETVVEMGAELQKR